MRKVSRIIKNKKDVKKLSRNAKKSLMIFIDIIIILVSLVLSLYLRVGAEDGRLLDIIIKDYFSHYLIILQVANHLQIPVDIHNLNIHELELYDCLDNCRSLYHTKKIWN